MGLMIGVDTTWDIATLRNALMEAGLLTTQAGANTLRLTPPLIVSADEDDPAHYRNRIAQSGYIAGQTQAQRVRPQQKITTEDKERRHMTTQPRHFIDLPDIDPQVIRDRTKCPPLESQEVLPAATFQRPEPCDGFRQAQHAHTDEL